MTYPETPREIAQELDSLRVAAASAWQRQDWLVAARRFEEAYRFLLDQQARFNRRLHKGWELYNGGVALVREGEYDDGLRRILLAYVEDILSADPGEEATADLEPARASWLGIDNAERFLDPIMKAAIERKGRDSCFDPQEIYDRAQDQFPSAPAEAVGQQMQAAREEARQIESLPQPFEQRCFIGCNYFSGGPSFQEIKETIVDEGFDPIVASEFDMPDADIHHRSLLLLHLCKKAIFEVTSPAGQLMELERCRDYGVRPLILRQVMPSTDSADSSVSAMIATMAEQDVKAYTTTQQLKALVKEYLSN